MKFRKRSPIMETYQWQPGTVIEGTFGEDCGVYHGGYAGCHIHSYIHGGFLLVRPGDWVITDLHGRNPGGLFVLPASMFEELYEPV